MKKLLLLTLLFCINQTKAQSVAIPQICMVGTDTLSNNNIIYWDKTQYTNIDSFILYRETVVNIYSRIGAQPYAALSKFVDTARSVGAPNGGDPSISEYRYKLQMCDSSGNYSGLSPYHTTVYMVNDTNGEFFWNYYQVENTAISPVMAFKLMRDDYSTSNFVSIAVTSGTQTTLIDPNYHIYANTATWRVDALGFNCTPTLQRNTSAAVTYSSTNKITNYAAGINQFANNIQLKIYPNPATNKISIDATNIAEV